MAAFAVPVFWRADDLACRRMEEGVHQYTVSPAVSKFCKVVLVVFSAVAGMLMLALVFMGRYVYHDHGLQNNFAMVGYSILGFGIIGAGILGARIEVPET